MIGLMAYIHVIDEALHKLQETAHEARRIRATSAAREACAKAFAGIFMRQSSIFAKRFDAFRNRFSEAVTESDVDPIFDEAYDETDFDMLDALRDAGESALIAGANVAIEQFKTDVSFDLHNPRAVAYMKEHGAALIKHIDDETRSLINTVLTEGIANGWSYDQIGRAIHDRYEDMSKARAERIAVHETGMAYEKGNRIVADDLSDGGLDMEHAWLTVGDSHVEQECLDNEAEGWIPLDQPFSSGDSEPLAHNGCRCTALYRRKGED